MKKSDMLSAAHNLAWLVRGEASDPNRVVTLVHRIKPGSERAIRTHLNSADFRERIEAARNVHFLLIFLQGIERLVLIGHFDTPAKESFIKFYCDNQDVLDDLWCRCEDFPEASRIDANSLMAFFQSGLQDSEFNYTAIPNVKLVEIQRALNWMKKTLHYQIELAKAPKSR